MKIINFLLAVLILASCNSNDPLLVDDGGPLVSLGTSVSSKVDETTKLSAAPGSSVSNIPVKVVNIEDSRCPMDAVCVWQGEAKVSFEIGNQSFALLIDEAKTFNFGGADYKLTLNNVTPYPSSTNQNERKTAVYVVEKV